MILALGFYIFLVTQNSYQSLKRSTEYRFANHTRINKEPLLQFQGRGKDQIELEGIIYPRLGNIDQVELMRQSALKGEPHILISSHGIFLGRFVIVSINETNSYFLPEGTPRKIEFSLTLENYGDDQD